MLTIQIGGEELFNEEKDQFETAPVAVLTLEHNLVSLSKWESKWESPFLDTQQKTAEQVLDYVRKMIVGPEPAPEVFTNISDASLLEINKYINAKMTATWVSESSNASRREEIITAELIYYWMISLGIPFECQYWHLNRLLMLIKVCNIKNSPKKKISFNDRAKIQRDLNDQRRSELGSSG